MVDLRVLAFRPTLTCSAPDGMEKLPVELLLMLLASAARLTLRLSRNMLSIGGSLGDSYAFGMAGTGGTSSSSSAVVVLLRLCESDDLGAGRRDAGPGTGSRGWAEPVDVLTVLKLMEDPTDRPELYDFRFISGVVRDEEGVAEAFRGIIEGERECSRCSRGGGGGASAMLFMF